MEKLITAAKEAFENSYSPYIKFPVGAAVKVRDGSIFLGTNIQNAVPSVSTCAEQNAINAAISNGYEGKDITHIVIYAETKELTYPCGVCRQTFMEFFDKDTKIIITNGMNTAVTNIDELVPHKFSEGNLNHGV